jgi:hypothetical protein
MKDAKQTSAPSLANAPADAGAGDRRSTRQMGPLPAAERCAGGGAVVCHAVPARRRALPRPTPLIVACRHTPFNAFGASRAAVRAGLTNAGSDRFRRTGLTVETAGVSKPLCVPFDESCSTSPAAAPESCLPRQRFAVQRQTVADPRHWARATSLMRGASCKTSSSITTPLRRISCPSM